MARLVIFALLWASQLVPAHAEQPVVQFCWCMGKYDNTVYFAEVENCEDRQTSFKELIEISGIDHHAVECRISEFGVASSAAPANIEKLARILNSKP